MDLIRAGVRDVDNVIRDIKGREKDSIFANTVKGVKEKLEKLPVSAFRGSDSETLAVMSLKRLIDKKFLPIAQQQLGLGQ